MAIAVLPVSGLCLEALGLVFHIIGLATPEWSVLDPISAGLWEFCTVNECHAYTSTDPVRKSSELKAAEAFAIIGMLLAALAVAAVCLYVILPILGRRINMPFHLVCSGTAVLAFGSIAVCVICWAAGVHADLPKPKGASSSSWDLGYSFGLSIAGGILLLLGGTLVFVGGKKSAA